MAADHGEARKRVEDFALEVASNRLGISLPRPLPAIVSDPRSKTKRPENMRTKGGPTYMGYYFRGRIHSVHWPNFGPEQTCNDYICNKVNKRKKCQPTTNCIRLQDLQSC